MNRSTLLRIAGAALPLMLVAFPAIAYVGPGAGLSVLGALWGLLIAVGVALGFVLLWPFRRFLKTKRSSGQTTHKQAMHKEEQTASGGRSESRG